VEGIKELMKGLIKNNPSYLCTCVYSWSSGGIFTPGIFGFLHASGTKAILIATTFCYALPGFSGSAIGRLVRK